MREVGDHRLILPETDGTARKEERWSVPRWTLSGGSARSLEEADADLPREMVRTFVQALMSAEADRVLRSALRGALGGAGEPPRAATGSAGGRPGPARSRLRSRSSAAGATSPAGSSSPAAAARSGPWCRSLRSTTSGASPPGRWRGSSGRSGPRRPRGPRSRSSPRSLDEEVRAFRTRPLDGAPYTYVWIDAQTQRVREAGRIVSAACVMATAVNRDGRKEVLGLDVVTTEDGAGRAAFLRDLVARGLSGVGALVTSDTHPGLREAIAATLPGASSKRCRTHFMRNLLAKVPKAAQPA